MKIFTQKDLANTLAIDFQSLANRLEVILPKKVTYELLAIVRKSTDNFSDSEIAKHLKTLQACGVIEKSGKKYIYNSDN